MNKQRMVPSLAWITLIILSACNLARSTPTITTDGGTTSDPITDQQTLVAISVQQTSAAAGGGALPPPAALPTYTFQPTYTIQYTDTPSTATVTVSIDTNCRTGPGSAYSIVGALLVGQTAEVVGRSASSDNWIVKLPGKTTTCWLWGQYATVTGSTSSLPIISPPPTPTFTVNPFISITIENNSSFTICYVYIRDSGDPSWGSNELSGFISPGFSYTWDNYLPDTYDVRIEDCITQVLIIWWNTNMFADTWLAYP